MLARRHKREKRPRKTIQRETNRGRETKMQKQSEADKETRKEEVTQTLRDRDKETQNDKFILCFPKNKP